MEYKDYYKTLGVPRTASQAEIKKAYRKLARQHHPDVKPGDKTAERTFKDINEAHTVLGDAEKRTKYDTLGANWEQFSQAADAGARRGGGQGGQSPFGAGGPFGGFDFGGAGGSGGGGGNVRYEFRSGGDGDLGGFSDFFRMVFGDDTMAGATRGGTPRGRASRASATATEVDDLLEQLRRDNAASENAGGRGATRSSRSLPPVEATAEITLDEAFHGSTRLVQIDGKRLEVKIPRGVDNGSRIRLQGQGGDGRDLIVVVRVRSHSTFIRRGTDLERELPITLREALLGAEVHVATLKGRVLLTIPETTQNGRTFRLKGQGMPRLNAEGSGDLLVRVRVVLPTNMSADAKTAAQQFLDLVPQPDPRQT